MGQAAVQRSPGQKRIRPHWVYDRQVQTAKTVSSLVRACPYLNLVLMLAGLRIGGPWTPFSNLRLWQSIRSEPLSPDFCFEKELSYGQAYILS